MTLARATDQLAALLQTYQSLSEADKFTLGKQFNDATGGKLSPYNSPSPVCVALVPVRGPDDQLGFLGVRRAIPPCVGEVALAGGFLGTSEDPIAGAIREVFEETGIALDPALFELNSQAHMAHNNNLLMFFTSRQELSFDVFQQANARLSLDTDGEASELIFVTPTTPLCFPLHQQAVNQAFLARGVAPAIQPAKAFKR